jgi:hypothetical protein
MILQQELLIILIHLVQRVKQHNDLQVLLRRIPLHKELEIPFFSLFQGLDQLEKFIF